jgi:hypothetical protein
MSTNGRGKGNDFLLLPMFSGIAATVQYTEVIYTHNSALKLDSPGL